jgi:hypothetical protein
MFVDLVVEIHQHYLKKTHFHCVDKNIKKLSSCKRGQFFFMFSSDLAQFFVVYTGGGHQNAIFFISKKSNIKNA